MSKIQYNGHDVKYGITHAGKFHADDVFSAVLLKHLFEDATTTLKFIRVDNVEYVAQDVLKEAIVFDIGDGEFDHHRTPFETRPNGTPYAALGKLWRYFAMPNIVSSQAAVDRFDRVFIHGLDNADTIGEFNNLAYLISTINTRTDLHGYDQEVAFQKALWVANVIFKPLLIDATLNDKNILIIENSIGQCDPEDGFACFKVDLGDWSYLEETYPWVKAVIYPSSHGGYSVRSLISTLRPQSGMVNLTEKFTMNRYLFPEQFRGHRDELRALFPDLGMKFCHANGFMAVFDEYDKALEYAKRNITRN